MDTPHVSTRIDLPRWHNYSPQIAGVFTPNFLAGFSQPIRYFEKILARLRHCIHLRMVVCFDRTYRNRRSLQLHPDRRPFQQIHSVFAASEQKPTGRSRVNCCRPLQIFHEIGLCEYVTSWTRGEPSHGRRCTDRHGEGIAQSHRSGDTEIGYWVSGEEPPIVLVNGPFGDQTPWDTLVAYLGSHATVHAIDQRGRGVSVDHPT